MKLKKAIAKAIGKATDLKEKKAFDLLEKPPRKELGDFSLPCFGLSKKNPKEKAKQLMKQIEKPKAIEKIKATGPYLNFFVSKEFIAEECISEILEKKKNYGKSDKGKKKRVMVEYSAPNTNKPLHVGHLRNDCIGMSVSKLFEFHDYNVIKANLVNDRGIHICKAMLAYQKFREFDTPQKGGVKGDKFVGDLYVKFNEQVKQNPELKKEARNLLKKWEEKDPETIKLWKKMRSWVLNGFKQTYTKFGSEFDEFFFESQFYDKAKPLIDLGLEKGVFKENRERAIVAQLESSGLPNKTVLRADGTSIYISNDLALTKHKQEEFNLNKNIFCVASEQDLYFKQLFKIFELLGFDWAKNCEHLSYGLVFLPEGKMKSREGKVIDADDLIKEIEELAAKEVKKRFPKLSKESIKKRAEAIALAAIKFSMLKIDHKKDFTFIPEQSISFEGESGPYIQYTYARAKSILRKAKNHPNPNLSLLTEKKEKEIIKKLAEFPEITKTALETRKIHLLCHYLLNLSENFNAYYHKIRVLGSAKKEAPRLALVKALSIVLKSGLSLLNIPVLEEM